MFKQFNGEMLVLARQARRLSQAAIAEQLGVSAGLVSKWSNGVVEPPPGRIAEVAKALGYPVSLLYHPEHVRGTDSICFHYRKRKTMPTRILEQVEAEMHLAQVQVNRLLRHLQIETSLDFLTLDPDEHGGPREVARALRGYWRISTGPIPNMVTLVEAAGAVVMLRDFRSRKLDGMSAWSKGTPPLFFLNQHNPVDRTRWTIAHELAHLVMHQTATEGDPEAEADTFAQELLIPTDEILPSLRRLSFAHLPALKLHWRVSMKALITTAKKLNVLPQKRIRSLFVQHSRAGYNQRELPALSPEIPTVVNNAIGVHLSEHEYTIPELASVVHLFPDEFSELYDLQDGGQQQHLRIV